MDEDQLREIFVQFALAVSHGQGVEQNLVTLLLMREKEESQLSPADYAERENLWSRKNLGRLIDSAHKKFGRAPRISDLLDEAREKRNMLVHRFFHDNAARLLDASCYASLLDELHAIRNILERTEKELHSIAEEALRRSLPGKLDYDNLVAQALAELRSKLGSESHY